MRDLEKVMFEEAFPYIGLSPDAEGSRRLMAIMTVLRGVPDDAYDRLCSLFRDKFIWFIPAYYELGRIHPFPATNDGEVMEIGDRQVMMMPSVPVVYLSPLLEKRAISIVTAVVAYELAHVFLHHSLIQPDMDDYNRQEDEAWELALAWGFEEQIKRYRLYRGRFRGDEW
jgi:hypothetical protein